MTYPRELFLRRKGSPEKSEFEPADTIKYAEVFRQIYPELSETVGYVSLDVMGFIVRNLEEFGLQSVLVRSGVQPILPIRADKLGLSETLGKKKLMYDPEHTARQRNRRHNLATAAEQIVANDPVIADVARSLSWIPDTDIKIGHRNTDLPQNFADSKLQELFDTQLVPAVSANRMYRNVRMEQPSNGRQVICADFEDLDSQSGVITLRLSVGSIATSRAKSNLALSLFDGGREVYGFQFGTFADSTHGAFSDSRVVTTTYSNEHISAPLSLKNGDLHFNPQEIDALLVDNKRISRKRMSDGVPEKDVESIFRSLRIQASEGQISRSVVGDIRKSFDEDTLAHMKRSVAALKGVIDSNEYNNLPTLITEVLAMVNIDAHAACVALVEIGAGDLLFGPNGNQRLIAALLSDSMTHTSISNLDGHPWREPLPITLRNKESIDESRRYYLKSNVSGLRLLYDGLFNTYSRVGSRNDNLSAEELHKFLRLMRNEDVGLLPDVKFQDKYISEEVGNAIDEFVNRKQIILKKYYGEGKVVYRNKRLRTSQDTQILKNHTQIAIESLLNMSKNGIAVVHVNDLITSLPKSVQQNVYVDESSISGDDREISHLDLVQALIGLGVVTEWGANHIVLTPKFIAKEILTTTSYYTSLADPKRLIALEAAKERIASFFNNPASHAKNRDDPKRYLRHQNLVRAMGIIDSIAPYNYLNFDTLLRSFPTADKIASKAFLYLNGGNSGVFEANDLDELEAYLTEYTVGYRDFIDRLPNDVRYSRKACLELMHSIRPGN